jgi:filamentous hemagglutinin family protein
LGHIKATATLTEGAMSEMTIRGRWFLGIMLVSAIACSGNSAIAQIIPNATLPNNSNVTINGSTFNINGGTQFGQNLFHSFQQFSVPTGGTAFFNNAVDIQNIFGRVTGGSVSNIDGLIRANGIANLFLINPSGIVFGPNASLNVGGSFVGTTANAIQFGTQGFFNATNPEAPSPLLTINPSALVFNQIAARIENKSTQSTGVDPAGFNAFGLRVPNGKSLLLVGGNINMDGGQLNAYGGRVELAGLATPGTVGLNVDGDKLSLDVPASSTRADISLTNRAAVYVEAGGGGNIAINARNLELSGGSILSAGIGRSLGSVGSQAGDITLNATGEIKVDNSSVYNDVQSQAVGNGGNIDITSGSLSLTNRAYLYGSTSGQGNGGNIKITTPGTVTFDNSRLYNDVQSQAVGNGGNIDITSGSFSLTNGALLYGSTSGNGNGGNIKITTPGTVTFDNSRVYNDVSNGAVGKGGNINITSGSLSLNLATLSASTYGEGNGGSVNIKTPGSVTVDNNSRVLSLISTPSVSNSAGGISIDTGSLKVANYSQLYSSNVFAGKGQAGDITIKARDLVLFNGGFALSRLEQGGIGKAGNISITTDGSVLVKGIPSNVANAQIGQLVTATFGEGDAGNITIKAGENVSFDGRGSDAYTLVGGYSGRGVGKAGNIRIDSRTLSVINGARLFSSTESEGNAGNINVTARDSIKVDGNGSLINTGVNSAATRGDGGTIFLKTEALSIANGAFVEASSDGNGKAGTVEVEAGSIRLDNKGTILSETVAGQGNIDLKARDFLLLLRGSNITTSATRTATGGNITINTNNLVAVPQENSDIKANAEESFGGRISINARGIFGIQFREQDTPLSDITASSALGPQFSGTVTINTPGIDPSRGLVQLPTDAVDIPRLVASGCNAFDSGGSGFTITGRGGLPPSPDEPLSNDVIWTDTRLPVTTSQQHNEKKPVAKPESKPIVIVPATGWVFNGKGEVTLISSASSNNGLGTTSNSCHSLR